MNDDFKDTLNLLSFMIGLMNLKENLTQGDKQELMSELDDKANKLLSEIHRHLEEQDEKLNKIMEELK